MESVARGGTPMQDKSFGMTLILVGLGAIAFALVVGLTKEGGGVDWISILTAAAGAVTAGIGLFTSFRSRGTGGSPTGSHA